MEAKIYAFVDKRIPARAKEELLNCGFSPVLIEPIPSLIGTAVESHTDLAIFQSGNTAIANKSYLSENPDIREALYSAFERVIESEYPIGREYPSDAAYNALALGGSLFARVKSACPDILSYAIGEGLKIVPVNQGYPACLTLKVGDAAVTSDEGLYRSFILDGKRALLIENCESIKLPPYRYGFIGGASGSFGKAIYFIGNLAAHSSGEKIKEFIESEGYSAVSLMPESDSLFDLGGIFFSEVAAERITAPKAGSITSPAKPKSE